MDLSLFHLVNNLGETAPWLSPLMVFSAKYLPLIFALTLVALWLTYQRHQQMGAFLAGVSTLAALGAAQAIAFCCPRPRPYINHTAHLLIERSQDPSFPSDHAVFTFAIATMIWGYNRKIGSILLGLAGLVSFARVYVGTHYPTDVVGGAILGVLASIVINKLAQLPKIKEAIDRFFAVLHRWHLAAGEDQ